MRPYVYVKQAIDFLLALIGMLVLWPVFLIIAIAIKTNSKGPILFKQKRLGKNKSEFYILKFRTMRTDTPNDMPTHLLKDPDFFITKVGKFLRKTSLDELPQIINILKGEMSIVGPRPALWNQYDLIAERDKYGANDIKPGLTGWAQINGRDELQIEEKAILDGHYVRRISISFDIFVFLKTIVGVLKSDGIKEGVAEPNVRNRNNKNLYENNSI
jgi:O-antigen biosynthesis protein WbqP